MTTFQAHTQRIMLCACLCAGMTLPAIADMPQWLEVRSAHFSVITDASPERGREAARRFEQMRALFASMTDRPKVDLPVPLQIIAFRNSKEFSRFAPLWQGKPTNPSGLFQPGQDRNFILLDLSTKDPWKVVFHEYAHQLLHLSVIAADLWFDEGFAEYFSTIEVENNQARVGKPPSSAFAILQQDGMMKIADLFKVRRDSATYNENNDHRNVFYAESNLLVHYLYDNGLLPKVSIYFALETNKNLQIEEAFQQAFGMSTAQFDKVLEAYIRGDSFKILPYPVLDAASDYLVTPLSTVDSGIVLADAHLHSTDYLDTAVSEFQEILKSVPNNAAACRGLGYAYLRKKRLEDAGIFFRRAAQLDSNDPRVHYYSALLLSQDGSFADHTQLPEAINELEIAVELDPNFADSYMLLGYALYQHGEWSYALESMEKAVDLDPGKESYRFNLAEILLANQKVEDCISVLHELEHTPDSQLAFRVRQLMDRAMKVQASARRVATSNSADDDDSQDP